MDGFSDDTEEPRFFDALEHIASNLDLTSDSINWNRDVWINTPRCVTVRRKKFISWMALYSDGIEEISFDETNGDAFSGDRDRIMEKSGAVLRTPMEKSGPVLRTPGVIDEFSSSRSSLSSWNTDDLESAQGVGFSECSRGSGNCRADKVVKHERLGKFHQLLSVRDVDRASNSPIQLVEREVVGYESSPITVNKMRDSWLCRLRAMTCLMNGNVKEDNVETNSVGQVQGKRLQRVGVRHCRRRLKELSALFTRQDIKAHEGKILSMKFSPDGKYLASAGEDKLVKVWQVVEDERLDTMDIPEVDPSCLYFSVNQHSELRHLMVEKDKINKPSHKTRNSACIVFPQNIFRLQEEPVNLFQGHSGEILDLSWSKNNCLLSSSVDRTVRLWRIGVDQCLRVFWHSDYVTCIQFNPVNDDYFISGSIDGKVRIWAVNGCQVVGWTETREIITAVTYRPDGKGVIFGSITGTCYFFDISDNQFQLETQLCLTSKKKASSCRRITGFQFLPQDPSKVLVTCADSQVRIIDGMNVIAKYKGLRNAGNYISASFTSDGNHIISASEDSNVYIWNYIGQEEHSFLHPKAIRSFECFPNDASVAVPWSGLKTANLSERQKSGQLSDSAINYLPFSPSTRFMLSQEFFSDTSSKVSATWPEEKLPASDPGTIASSMSKSQYKLFKTSWQNLSMSHAWGLVIVTASWDGRIRSFHNYGLPASI